MDFYSFLDSRLRGSDTGGPLTRGGAEGTAGLSRKGKRPIASWG